ncbi:MAG: thiamine phosphate synthase [Oscillospiraceae bacterium]
MGGGRGLFFRQVAAAVAGGADIVQLREKHLDPQAFLTEAKRFVALCREQGALSIINDSAEIAAQAGADGVHVGQGDLEASHARALLGPDKLIGVSAHTVEEALRAQAAGADYLGVGAAFVTGTKADASPISRETIRAITAAVNIPVVAIGGISQNNILQLKGCGLDGVAVVFPPLRTAGCAGRGPRAQAAFRGDGPVIVPHGNSGLPAVSGGRLGAPPSVA